jgi:hypothetical protein
MLSAAVRLGACAAASRARVEQAVPDAVRLGAGRDAQTAVITEGVIELHRNQAGELVDLAADRDRVLRTGLDASAAALAELGGEHDLGSLLCHLCDRA